MTTEEIIALAKEKLGKDITEQEAQDYLSGKTPLPDEALELVSGGGSCKGTDYDHIRCPICNQVAYMMEAQHQYEYGCDRCRINFNEKQGTSHVKWEIRIKCRKCGGYSYYEAYNDWGIKYRCRTCGSSVN